VIQEVLVDRELVLLNLHLAIGIPQVDHGIELVVAHRAFQRILV
jgi:hypothetical protein